ALAREASTGGGDLVGGRDFHAQVVQPSLGCGVLDEHELEGRLGDGEVCVTRAALGRFGDEELGVELHGGVEVGDVEGKLNAGHGSSCGNICLCRYLAMSIDRCQYDFRRF